MEVKRRFVIKHRSGIPVNLFYEPVKSLSAAARFNTKEEAEAHLMGLYKPLEPTYIAQEIEITYREIDEDG